MKPFFTEADFETVYSAELRQCIVDIAHRLLEYRGKIVYGFWKDGLFVANEQPSQRDTHTAFLINIEPIKQDSAEKFLKEWVQCADAYASQIIEGPFKAFADRAKAILAKEGE